MRSLLGRAAPYTPGALSVAGLGWLDAAAWALNPIAGMAAIGVSCLLLGWAAERR